MNHRDRPHTRRIVDEVTIVDAVTVQVCAANGPITIVTYLAKTNECVTGIAVFIQTVIPYSGKCDETLQWGQMRVMT